MIINTLYYILVHFIDLEKNAISLLLFQYRPYVTPRTLLWTFYVI